MAGVDPSVGRVGDSYDNALAETTNGLYKTEVIRRLLEPIGNIPPAEAEARDYAQTEDVARRRDSSRSASGNPGAVHPRAGRLVKVWGDSGRADAYSARSLRGGEPPSRRWVLPQNDEAERT